MASLCAGTPVGPIGSAVELHVVEEEKVAIGTVSACAAAPPQLPLPSPLQPRPPTAQQVSDTPHFCLHD